MDPLGAVMGSTCEQAKAAVARDFFEEKKKEKEQLKAGQSWQKEQSKRRNLRMVAMAKMPRIHSAAREEAIVAADSDVEHAKPPSLQKNEEEAQYFEGQEQGSKGKCS